MFKKTGIILAALLYFVTANGFAMNLHFCGESIASININQPAKNCSMSSKCCKTTHLEVKVKDAHQIVHTVFSSINLASPVVIFQGDFYREPVTISCKQSFSAQLRPPPNNQPIFLENQNFRI